MGLSAFVLIVTFCHFWWWISCT